jgi:AsmA protein
MRRALAATLLLGLLLLIILGLAGGFLFDRPPVRAMLIEQAERATGLDWEIGAGPGLSWQPLPQIHLAEIRLRHPQRPELPELHIQELRLVIPWSALFNARPWPQRVSAQALLSGGMRLEAELEAEPGAGDEPLVSGRIALAPVDLRTWLLEQGVQPPLPIPLAKEQSLRMVAARMDFHAQAGAVQTDSLWMRFDDSEVWGQALLQFKPHPQVSLALQIDRLDLERYLPEPPQVAQQAPVSLPASALMQVTPLTGVSAAGAPWSLSGTIDIQALQLAALTLGSAQLRPRLQAPQLSAELTLPACYGGQLEGFFRLDPLGAQSPGVELLAQGHDIELAPLLHDWRGEATLAGTAGFSLELTARGGDRATLERSLAGDFAILVRQARVQEVPLDQLLAAAGVQRSARMELPEIAGFDVISATFHGQNGQFHSEDVRAASEILEIAGSGRLGIPEQQLEFALTAMLREGPQGGGINELNGLPMPLRIHGSWQAPEVRLDPGPALREAAARVLDKQLERHREPLQKIEERTGLQGLEQSLRQLLGDP